MRRVVQLYEQTSTAGGALDTGALDVEEFDSVTANFVVAGNLANLAGYQRSEGSVDKVFYSEANVAVGGWRWIVLGEGPLTFVPATGFGGPPVPRRVRFTSASGAGGTVALTITGVRREED